MQFYNIDACFKIRDICIVVLIKVYLCILNYYKNTNLYYIQIKNATFTLISVLNKDFYI